MNMRKIRRTKMEAISDLGMPIVDCEMMLKFETRILSNVNFAYCLIDKF